MELGLMNLTLTDSEQRELECSLATLNHALKPGHCPSIFDGVLCWPPSIAGTVIHQPCLSELHGVRYDTSQNASKTCYANGTWENFTDFAACYDHVHERQPEDMDSGWVEITTAMYATGFGISLVALCFAVWIFAYFKELRCLRNTIHTNLMCTYILADLLWFLNFGLQNTFNRESGSDPIVVLCGLLHVLLHYFHLTSFFWMFVEGLYLYMLVVETFTRDNIKLRGYLAIGWGIPLIIVTVWASSKTIYSVYYDDTKQDVSVEACCACTWLIPNLADHIYNGLAISVLVANLLFLTMIMWVLITKLRSSNNVETQQYRKASKALLVLIPLLGVTYILLIIGPSSHIYDGIRIFLLSTQGLMVALFYCFLNTEVQNTMRHHITRWRESRNISNRYNFSKDWSPNTKNESVRLYSKQGTAPFRKRESATSETTTLTVVGSYGGGSRLSNGSSALPPLRPIVAQPSINPK